jgi:ribosomal protein L9
VVALLAEAGHEFPEKAVRIDTPIRTIGEHAIRLHVHGDHYAEVTVAVQPEEPPEAAS